jgi:hypothetical protein
VKLAFESLLSAYQRVSASRRVSRSLFAAPLFSQPYELLFPQALCFDNHLNCPRGVPLWPLCSDLRALCVALSPASLVQCFQQLAASLALLALFFELPFFVFSNFQTLFAKHRGWGISLSNAFTGHRGWGTLPLALRTSALSAPLRYPLDFSDHLAPRPVSFDFQLPTVDFPSIMLKFTRTAYDHS